MKTDQQLADALRERGIIERHVRRITHQYVYRVSGTVQYHSAESIVRDWRTAGACIIEAHSRGWIVTINPEKPCWVCIHTENETFEVEDDNMPRGHLPGFRGGKEMNRYYTYTEDGMLHMGPKKREGKTDEWYIREGVETGGWMALDQ